MRKKVKICLGCLREISIHTGICPYCGFDPLKSENPRFLRVGTRLAKRYTVGKRWEKGDLESPIPDTIIKKNGR